MQDIPKPVACWPGTWTLCTKTVPSGTSSYFGVTIGSTRTKLSQLKPWKLLNHHRQACICCSIASTASRHPSHATNTQLAALHQHRHSVQQCVFRQARLLATVPCSQLDTDRLQQLYVSWRIRSSAGCWAVNVTQIKAVASDATKCFDATSQLADISHCLQSVRLQSLPHAAASCSLSTSSPS